MNSGMNGYDKEEALAFILPRINRKEHALLADRIEQLISQAIDADIAFMHGSGVLDQDGNAGTAYYEEDDAFEYIVETLAAANDLTPDQAVKMASLIDDFMDGQAAYMAYAGLIQDED